MAEAGDLVIGIGNPLRGDDGAGWWLARRARRRRPAPRVLLVQQLTPELADALASVRRVLFVDAWLPPGGMAPAGSGQGEPSWQPCLRPLQSGGSPGPPAGGGGEAGGFSHRLDPQQLLAITTLLHGGAPAAWQLLLPARALPHGSGFSAELRRLLPAAERLLSHWCEPGAGGGASDDA